MRPALVVPAALAALLAGPALADSFAPVGLWRGEDSGDFLLVVGEGFCSTGGTVTALGPCTWAPRDHAGTLSLTTQRPDGPETLAVTVEWLGQDTILVNGAERFRRSG